MADIAKTPVYFGPVYRGERSAAAPLPIPKLVADAFDDEQIAVEDVRFNHRVAGAARVVVSLWNVNDKATSDLMAKFYQ